MGGEIQLERAINEIQRRRQGDTPNIDFTQYRLDNGRVVSTQERFVPEVFSISPQPVSICSLTENSLHRARHA